MIVLTIQTPLTAHDARCLLGIDSVEYELERANGRLPASVLMDGDPTGRFAFHNFWDVLSYLAFRELGSAGQTLLRSQVDDALDLLAGELAAFSADASSQTIEWHAARDGCWATPPGLAGSDDSPMLTEIDAWVAQLADLVARAVVRHLRSVIAGRRLPTSPLIPKPANFEHEPRRALRQG